MRSIEKASGITAIALMLISCAAASASAANSTPAAGVEPYVIGSLTYTLSNDVPADKVAAIRDAMDFAIAHDNTLAAYSGNVWVTYSSGTPSADSSYRGQIRFGGSISRRVALHELAHWLGTGSTNEWRNLLSGGVFTGKIATARIKAFDGPDAVLHGDIQHFWPYGVNFEPEFSNTQRNILLVSAEVADAGLSDDVATAIVGTRRFQNRSSHFVLQGAASGYAPIETSNSTNANQQWQVTFTDGFIKLVNKDSGLALESMGVTGGNAPADLASLSNSTQQQWEMMAVGEGGWFLLRNRATGNCLDNSNVLTEGAPLKLQSCGFNVNQQWQLIK